MTEAEKELISAVLDSERFYHDRIEKARHRVALERLAARRPNWPEELKQRHREFLDRKLAYALEALRNDGFDPTNTVVEWAKEWEAEQAAKGVELPRHFWDFSVG